MMSMSLLTALAWGLSHMSLTVPAQHLPLQKLCWFEQSHERCIIAEVATTPEQKAQGLMYRPWLPKNYGMLFAREQENYRSFWMKNTMIPLNIIFLDTKKHLVDQTQMFPCTTQPCPFYRSSAPAQYVVEVMSD